MNASVASQKNVSFELLLSQSVFCQFLDIVGNDGMFQTRCLMEKQYFIKRTQRRWCYYITSERLNIKFWTEKTLYTFHSCTKHPFANLLKTKYLARKQFCINTLERNELKVFTSLMKNKFTCFANS